MSKRDIIIKPIKRIKDAYKREKYLRDTNVPKEEEKPFNEVLSNVMKKYEGVGY